MAFSNQNQAVVAFKNLLGKSNTDVSKGVNNEAEGIFFNIGSDKVWMSVIGPTPSVAVSNGVAVEVTADLIADLTSNGHAFFAQWPSTPPTGTDPKTSNPYTYGVGTLVGISAGDRVIDGISSVYGNGYEAKPYDNSAALIPPGDPRDWIFQYNSGIFFQQNIVGGTPTTIKIYAYRGELLSNSSSGTGAGNGLLIKYRITPSESIIIPTYSQYWLYGDLTIEGTLTNHGQLVVANGQIIISGSGSYNDFGQTSLLSLGAGASPSQYNDSPTIGFNVQNTIFGPSISAYVKDGSLTASQLSANGGATAGYVLSAGSNGNFEWVTPGYGTSLEVVDYVTGNSFSAVSTMIFRGGAISVPGGTATGVVVTGTSPTVTIWIPAPNYVGYFTPTLASGTSRYISQPTTNTYNGTPGNPGIFGHGSWSPSADFSSSTSRLSINSSGSLTAFYETEFGCYNNGTTMSFYLYNHDGTVLSSIDSYVLNGSGSTTSNGITITVNSFLPDSDRYKANVTGTIDVGTLFPNGGRFSWNVTHYNGEGPGNAGYGIYSFSSSDIFYDSDGSSSSANISGLVDFDEKTPTTVQYSGVKFYALGSSFALTASDVNLLNDITFPVTKQIDFSCFNLAVSGTLDGYADGSKGAGSAITGWSIDWNNTGLTYSRTATSNVSGAYIPDFSTNNTISTTPNSYVTATLFDWTTVGSSQSGSRLMLFDTVSPGSVTYDNNPLDSETGRLSTTGVLTNGSSSFDSTLSLSTSNTDELQYIFGRVIFPQTNFTLFYPTFDFTASVNYSSLTGVNKNFTVYTDTSSDNGTTTTQAFNGYRWHVTSYGKDASYATGFANGIFTLNSNFSESYLDYDIVNTTSGSGDLVILVGIDSTSANLTPDKFLFVSGDPTSWGGVRVGGGSYHLNLGSSSKSIQWSKGLLTAVVKKVWLFVGYKDSVTGKNLYMTNIAFA